MKVLIVESNEELGTLWERHLTREGFAVQRAADADSAVDLVAKGSFAVVILDLNLESGSPLAVADYVSYRQPSARIVFVTRRSFFTDGSIFSLSPSACAYLPAHTPPEDLTAIIEHYGQAS
ncbi:Response regulator receiver domain-containing protein [Poseidonocella pacifica]|uniref:Response regulator receiver domain-containing protein n=1 Tax=Poseidonocella pacifica TaxID=871651 RepID=A0A1I0Y4V8_9RHOB|nr:response regulator [Poseidonocella pacifica]SFB07468.1 Response regulator receiver domain-containing protein [Poseidonocella pacifica]